MSDLIRTILASVIAEYVVLVVAVTGVLLNNRKIIWCFPVWILSNSLSAGLHVQGEMYGLMWCDVTFIVLAVLGWRSCAKKTAATEPGRDRRKGLNDSITG